METLLYTNCRPFIRVGDIVGCRGEKIVSKGIRLFKGGEWNWSHVAIIIRDTTNEGTQRVEVLEAIGGGGMQRNYLSKVYEKDHGKLFWLKMDCSEDQREQIMELGAQMRERKTKYDYRSTWLALFSPIFVDAQKFNCSESAWYLLTQVGRLLKRYKKSREIAPIPGDFPVWAGVEPFGIDMQSKH